MTETAWEIDGIAYKRLRYGQEERFGELGIPEVRCPNCGVTEGRVHDWGCDWEECPCCHGQAISCDCHDDEEVEC